MNKGCEVFGKDHWSLMAYLGYLAANNMNIQNNKMRCNNTKHPLLAWADHVVWDDSYSTYLKDGSQIPSHDDWDCLNDLEQLNFVEVISLINGAFKLTDMGFECVHQLTIHKASGKKYKDFEFKQLYRDDVGSGVDNNHDSGFNASGVQEQSN